MLIALMKTIYLFLFLCLAASVVAEEVLPEEVKIDPLLSIKEQFSKARKKGWDFSEEQKKSEVLNKSDGIAFEWQPTDVSDQRAKSFRSDITEVERMKATDRRNEMERNVNPPRKKSR